MAGGGEDDLSSAARRIAETLSQNDYTPEEILQVFSQLDTRLTREGIAMNGLVDSRGCATLGQVLDSLDRRISQYIANSRPIWYDRADSSAFLELIDQLLMTLREWSPLITEKPANSMFRRAEILLNHSMIRLEEEFKVLMEHSENYVEHRQGYSESRYSGCLSLEAEEIDERGKSVSGRLDQIPVARQVTHYDIHIDALPSGAMVDVHEIVKRMIAGGFDGRCSALYGSCRRAFLDESLSRLGLQKLSIEETQKMPWAELEDAIDRWTKVANAALRIFFPSERRLCEEIFNGFPHVSDLTFAEVIQEAVIRLMSLPYAVVVGSRSPERLFKILDLYELLRDVVPEFEALCANQHCVFIRNEVNLIFRKVGEAIRGILMELENLISRDPARTPVPHGGVHPITRYVMNYLRAACRSREPLEQIFDECVTRRRVDGLSFSSPLILQIAWIMELLDRNLETKSRIYADPPLSCVFMMNNQCYNLEKARHSELGLLLGDEWVRRLHSKVRKNAAQYQKKSWGKIVEGLEAVGATVERYKLFSSQFDELCTAQRTWLILDEDLGKELRRDIHENLLPAYRRFIENLMASSENRKRLEKSVYLYSVKDVENRVHQLFRQ